jgi:hypothetical protein
MASGGQVEAGPVEEQQMLLVKQADYQPLAIGGLADVRVKPREQVQGTGGLDTVHGAVVVTADAAHAQYETAEYIAGSKDHGNREADYFLFVKGNQPSLQRAIYDAIQHDGPREPDHVELDYSHGRIIKR